MSKRKNPRLVKVKTILDSADAKLLSLYSKSLDSANVRNVVLDSFAVIRKNADDNTSLIQKQLDSFRSYVEKSFILNFIVLSLITLILVLS